MTKEGDERSKNMGRLVGGRLSALALTPGPTDLASLGTQTGCLPIGIAPQLKGSVSMEESWRRHHVGTDSHIGKEPGENAL